MNRDTLKGQWTQIKGKVREQWGKLADDDLDQMQGNAEQLIGKLPGAVRGVANRPSRNSIAGSTSRASARRRSGTARD